MGLAGTGHQSRVAIGKQTNFDTVKTVTDLAPLISEDSSQEFIRAVDEVLCGNAGRVSDTRTGRIVTVPLTLDGVYDNVNVNPFGIELFLLAVMGTTSRTGDFNRYTLKDVLDTNLTIAINKGGISAFEYLGSKCDGMTFSIDQDGLAQFTFPFFCKTRFKTGDGSITNNIADINALNKSTLTKLKWQDMTVRLGDLANILVDADKIKVTSISIDFARNMMTDDRGSPENTGHTDSELIEEPVENGKRDVTMSITFSRYESNTFIDFQDADTKLQMDIKFANGTQNFDIFIPNFKILSAPTPIADAGKLIQTLECVLSLNSGDNTTMLFNDASTSVDEEFAIEVDSARVATP